MERSEIRGPGFPHSASAFALRASADLKPAEARAASEGGALHAGYVGLMAIARAAAWYQLIDLKRLVRRAGLRFLLAVLRVGMLRFLVRLLDI